MPDDLRDDRVQENAEADRDNVPPHIEVEESKPKTAKEREAEKLRRIAELEEEKLRQKEEDERKKELYRRRKKRRLINAFFPSEESKI